MEPGFSKQNQRFDGSSYRFADFMLEPSERMLTRAERPVSIQPKMFDALLLLVLHAGHLVSKAELKHLLWPDTHVKETNLTNVIVSLRKLLGRDSIRTVSKYGYRFALPVLCEPGVDGRTHELFLQARTIIQTRSLAEMPRARDLLMLCVARSPSFAQGWAWLGRSCLFLNKFSEGSPLNGDIAQAFLGRALSLRPDLSDAHAFLTMHQVDSGRADDALVRLAEQLTSRPRQPDLYAGLVHALRFRGLLGESLQADKYARELEPTIHTSVAHTLFLKGDFAGCIEAYTGRTAYYLDAAAWASLGMLDRAARLLELRVATLPSSSSSLLRTLLESLRSAIRGEPKGVLKALDPASFRCEPEMMIYFARHLSYVDEGEKAVAALETAAKFGFHIAPEMLHNDPWLMSVRQHRGFESLLDMAIAGVRAARSTFRTASSRIPVCLKMFKAEAQN